MVTGIVTGIVPVMMPVIATGIVTVLATGIVSVIMTGIVTGIVTGTGLVANEGIYDQRIDTAACNSRGADTPGSSAGNNRVKGVEAQGPTLTVALAPMEIFDGSGAASAA
jgi:hypothetical protein